MSGQDAVLMTGAEIAAAQNAFFDNYANLLEGEASGRYLRNRLEVAFQAGIGVAEQRLTPSATPASDEAVGDARYERLASAAQAYMDAVVGWDAGAPDGLGALDTRSGEEMEGVRLTAARDELRAALSARTAAPAEQAAKDAHYDKLVNNPNPDKLATFAARLAPIAPDARGVEAGASSSVGDDLALHEFRSRPNWRDSDWSPWTACSEGAFNDYNRTPLLHDWLYETRTLYTHPAPTPLARSVEAGALPELPEPAMRYQLHMLKPAIGYYDADQMHAYATLARSVDGLSGEESAALERVEAGMALVGKFTHSATNVTFSGDDVRTLARIARRLAGAKVQDVCPHGIRWPHECRPCADAAWSAAQSGNTTRESK